MTTLDVLTRQLRTAWSLTELHLEGLTTEECLWRPAARGLHVHGAANGEWVADWPDTEGYDLGPSSIAWTTWHIAFWWSMALDHSFGPATLDRDAVRWAGSAEGAIAAIRGCHDRWIAAIVPLNDAELDSSERTKWPFTDRPFADVIAWLNVELMKNAAEIGYARFLYAVRAYP